MAEHLMRHALAAEAPPLKHFKVASAGVAAWNGEPASSHAVTALKKVGIDLHHESQLVSQELLDECFTVFCMTQGHKESLMRQFDVLPPHVLCMRALIPGISPETLEIADPYGQDLRAYVECRDEMIEAIPSLLHFLKENCL
jgi:protein-tyrosine-phosphatase